MKEYEFGDRIWNWLLTLPRAALAAGAIAATVLFATAAAYAYRTYDYVQHDNEFCLSCHLMIDPFERFTRSAHRDMGCKACHQPNMIERSRMALTQVIENPDTLSAHAEVPNERCAGCHIDGDPEEWTLVAASAGHRVHFESKDPALQGLLCVECHSVSLHVFTASILTCGQAGCHPDTKVRLGRMNDLTIHCAGCHAFTAPIADTGRAAVTAALQPTKSECLSCHAMRTLVEMPADDPHGGVCAFCHNAHDQTTPAEAGRNCAVAGCHSSPDTISPFHRGLAPGILQACVSCHAAHEFRTPGTNCTDCHKDIEERGSGTRSMRMGVTQGTGIGGPVDGTVGGPFPDSEPSPFLHPVRSGTPAPQEAAPRPPTRQTESGRFRHAEHRGVACLECHSTDETHGALKVVRPRDCQACHHAPRNTAGPNGCTRCHAPGAFATGPITWTQEMRFADGQAASRELPFDHDMHTGRGCTECHTQPLSLGVGELSCVTCHAEHHEAGADCTACHRTPPESAHDVRSHLTCGGAACHLQAPIDPAARTRSLCLACHQDRSDHRPGETCVKCHPLPPASPRTGAGHPRAP